MTEAFIFDHVRTPARPRQAGWLAPYRVDAASRRDGAEGDQGPQPARTDPVDDVVMGCVDPVGEAGGDIARMGALAGGLRRHGARRADQPLLRLGPRIR